jgi:serine/threonine protein kinase
MRNASQRESPPLPSTPSLSAGTSPHPQALKYLHEQQIVHRDLKPENILLQHRSSYGPPQVKIADFGLAKLVGNEKMASTFCGTPQYFAPEVLESRNSHRGYDTACDLWSLGVILYILLCGSPPFSDNSSQGPSQGGSQLSIFDQIKAGVSQAHFEGGGWPGISAAAKQLVQGLLVVDPRGRLTVDGALQHPWMRGETVVPLDRYNTATDDIEESDSDGEQPSHRRMPMAITETKSSKRQRTTAQQGHARSVVPPLQTQQPPLQPPPPTQVAFKAPLPAVPKLTPPPSKPMKPSNSNVRALQVLGGDLGGDPTAA